MENKLKELINKIVREEIMGEGNKLYTLKNQADANKGLPTTLDPDDATEKSTAFTAKYKPVSEMARKAEVKYTLKPDFRDDLEAVKSKLSVYRKRKVR